MKSKQVKEVEVITDPDNYKEIESTLGPDDVVKVVDESNEKEVEQKFYRKYGKKINLNNSEFTPEEREEIEAIVKNIPKKIKKESFKIKKSAINEMINDKLANRVSIGDHSLKDNPSLPKLSGEDYLMKLVDLKYEDICKTIKTNYGVDSVDFTEILPDFYKNLKKHFFI
jgi:hypothetical protein